MTDRDRPEAPSEQPRPAAQPVYPVPPERPVNEGLIGEVQKGQKPPAETR